MCERERERETERQSERHTDRERRGMNVVRGNREREREKRERGEWDFVGDRLSPAVNLPEPVASELKPQGVRLPRILRGSSPGGVYRYFF